MFCVSCFYDGWENRQRANEPKYAVGDIVITTGHYRCAVVSATFNVRRGEWYYQLSHPTWKWANVINWSESNLKTNADIRQEYEVIRESLRRKLASMNFRRVS